MSEIELIAPTLFGIESITSKEIKKLGYPVIRVEDGRVTFKGDEAAVCRSNIWLRTAERVLVKMGEFKALTFDELFEKTKALPWSDWIPLNGKFPIKGHSLRSKLYSVPDCQAIIKKAVVEQLKTKYNKNWFDETGPLYQIQFILMKDMATLMIDTSGNGLHKRGYRANANEAPLRETLASAMIMLSNWRYGRPMLDPFCGSGTIPIEAAMIGTNTAPGLQRKFTSERWPVIPKESWLEARREALDKLKSDIQLNIMGSDIDVKAIRLSSVNARKAGVERHVTFKTMQFSDLNPSSEYSCIICNPPYGERMGDLAEIEKLYRQMGEVSSKFKKLSFYILTSHPHFEELFGRRAIRRRKLYNGMIKCCYYQYPSDK
jgi:putative N6-adenine-specific DNA methylase